MIDFTNCKIDKISKYEGSDQKRAIIYNNKRYMLKMSDKISSENRNELNSSYSNSMFSEHICCNIVKTLNLDVQNTLLGSLTMQSSTGEAKIIPVVACENFLNANEELLEFKKIQNALQADKPGKIPKLNEIYEILGKENLYLSKDLAQLGLERYWDTFIIDALLGNYDRHGNNWGFIINKNTQNMSLAPIYDCGSCLYPQIADDDIEAILNNASEIEKRINVFPTAALEHNGIKVNYKEYINSLCNEDCTAALKRIFPNINLSKVNAIIDSINEISSIRKLFYKTMIKKRMDLILEPAYIKAQ